MCLQVSVSLQPWEVPRHSTIEGVRTVEGCRDPDSHKRGSTAHDNTRIMPLKTAMRLQATYIMQTLLMDIWNAMRRAQAAAKRIRDEEVGESSDAQDAAPPKRQRLDSASASSPAQVDRTLCCLHTLKPHVTPHGLGPGAATFVDCIFLIPAVASSVSSIPLFSWQAVSRHSIHKAPNAVLSYCFQLLVCSDCLRTVLHHQEAALYAALSLCLLCILCRAS